MIICPRKTYQRVLAGLTNRNKNIIIITCYSQVNTALLIFVITFIDITLCPRGVTSHSTALRYRNMLPHLILNGLFTHFSYIEKLECVRIN